MKSIILAAGYATRLYPLTLNTPKPLLRIGGQTILGRLIDDIDRFPEIDSHIIVTNHKFADQFRQWASEQNYTKPITVIDDGTTDNENRLGAVRDLLLALDTLPADDDILLLAADNILDFSLRSLIDDFAANHRSLIMCYHEPRLERLQRTGVIQIDPTGRVTLMQEKPAEPVSEWAVPPFYLYSRADLPLIRTAVDAGCNPDAPGSLARHLVPLTHLRAHHMPGTRLDIGSLDTYRAALAQYGE